VKNSVISTEGDSIYYEALTQSWTAHITQVKKLDHVTGEMFVIAEIERRKGQEPAIKFKDEKSFSPASEFISSDNPFSLQGKFRAPNGKAYKWVVKNGHLELYKYEIDENDGNPKPLAVFRKQRRYFFCGLISRHPSLTVQPEVRESLDAIIVSFLLMERLRRDSRLTIRKRG